MIRTQQRTIAVLSAVAHLLLGAGILVDLGAVASSPAWAVFSRVLPDWAWPVIFILIGLLAAGGVASLRSLRLSLYLGAPVMWAWAAALIVAWATGTGPPPLNAVWLGYIGGLKWMLADSGVRLDFLRDGIREVTDTARGGQWGAG